MGVGRRLILGAVVIAGFTLFAPGVALAHTLTLLPSAVCVDGGGWRASAVLTPSDPGPTITGTMTITPPGSSTDWSLAPNQSQTFNSPILSTSVSSVTFATDATWADGFEGSAQTTADQPAGCTPVTTTSTSTTTTSTTSTTSTTTTTPTTTSTTTSTTSTTVPATTTTTSSTTSTTVPGSTTTSTTTTLPSTLTISAITPLCQRDAPFVEVTFGNQPEFNGHTATITFLDINGVVVGTHTATYGANTSVRFIYPGASVDAAGNATDWPGWRFDGDDWVLDPTDAYLRDGLTVRVEVNPVATGQVSYPAPDSGCANPVNPPRGGGSPDLPVTGGGGNGPTAAIAAAAVALGGFALLLARRRPGRTT